VAPILKTPCAVAVYPNSAKANKTTNFFILLKCLS
jgi:hypothetical protein